MTLAALALVPRLTTTRLVLRELRATDFDGFAESMVDPIATQHLTGVVDRRTAWRIFSSATGVWMLHGAGWWGVEEQASGETIGMVGAFIRETSPEMEIGWSLYRRFWQRGFATEAASAALSFAFEHHKPDYVIAHIDTPNLPSIAVSKRLGMRYERDVDLYDKVVGRYVIHRGD